jgi:hypothetical protein
VRGSAPRQPRLVQVVTNPAHAEAAPVGEADADAAHASDAPAREDAARSPAAKRSRPPYLRLVD